MIDGLATDPLAVIHGDCREEMPRLPEASVDAIVTDPPYAIGFMEKHWDDDVALDAAVWASALRALKPGGYLLAFGGTRTFHRMACAIEDAGFTIRDCISWLYGSGFPKSLNIAKAFDRAAGQQGELLGTIHTRDITNGDGLPRGARALSAASRPGPEYVEHEVRAPASELARRWAGWGTALKPAWEPIIVAQKPLDGTYARNLAEHGVGALNIDASRIGTERVQRTRNTAFGMMNDDGWQPKPQVHEEIGRWPANAILDEEAAALLDEQASGASRFFYVPKATARDRTPAGGPRRTTGYSFNSRVCNVCGSRGKAPGPNAGGQPWPTCGHEDWRWEAPLPDGVREEGVNTHPTVKPVELMRYLVRLVTPPGGIVLDPFAGSGTTGQAALAEGFRCVLIEREAEYVEGIRRWRGAMQIGLGL